MASAILPSRNDPRSSDCMSKFTDSSNFSFTRLQNFPNPNPNSSNCFIGNTGREVLWKNPQNLPSSAPPEAGFIRSSINSVPANSGFRYITFRLDTYTRNELKLLKKQLMSDLERVRSVRKFVCSTPMVKRSYHAPQLELPMAPKAPEAHLTVKEREKSAIGPKRAKNLPLVRDTKKQCGRVTNVQRRKMMMRECGQILGKLMKNKHGWVFNTPVDAAAMKLYDYHNVIKNPMDLGTIKSKLAKNEYESPLAFASDVRLTFENAMLYNGRGSDVYAMAERFLVLFEDMFRSTHMKSVVNQAKKPNCSGNVPNSVEKPVPNATVVVEAPVVVQSKAANLGKPMIRVANKPVMTADEKSELAACLFNLQLGPEGTNQIMAIVKKGAGLEHTGDEIELDLAVLDNETLWKLHSFMGRTLEKQTAAAACNMKGVITGIVSSSPACEEHLMEEQGRKRDGGEEYVDIGDEMQLTDFPLIEIEKDVVNCGGSSSSSESSSDSDSSSSDSGSGNSYNEQEVNSTPNGVVL